MLNGLSVKSSYWRSSLRISKKTAKTNHVKSSDCVSNEGAKLILLSSAFINPYALTWFRYFLLDLCLVRPLIKSFMSKCLLTNSTDSNVVTQLFFQNSGGFSNPNNFSHLSFAVHNHIWFLRRKCMRHIVCVVLFISQMSSAKKTTAHGCVLIPRHRCDDSYSICIYHLGTNGWRWSCTLSHSFWNVGFRANN